jgi:hypothetical protein
MSSDQPFDDKYWNLSQACAWVEYREKQLVNDFSVADRNAYMALGMYPSMWAAGRKRHGSVENLRRALEQGRMKSSGYRRHTPESLKEIPAAEWTDFVIRPPLVSFSSQPQNIPWEGVRVLSADMKRLWRSVNEVEGRSTFDWAAIRPIYELLKTQNPEMSKNELITEAQGAFEDRFNKSAPSITSFKRQIKSWT